MMKKSLPEKMKRWISHF